ncbi:hypothetical protein ACFW04_013737 [Cataglyphis niger]
MTAYNVMRKWNLKFSGARGEDAETFLMRDILRCLPFFLSGIALHWFRGRRDRLSTWAAFRSAWRMRFGDPDFQFALRDEITRRTQGEQESVADYLTCLRAMYDRLSSPWSATEQISYAFRNMLPRLQIAMRREEVDDLDALEDLATRIEASHQLAQRYRAPPTPDKSLFPDLAYRSPRYVNRPTRRQDAIAALATTFPPPATDRIRPSRVSTAKCWNCNGIGHLSRDCEAAPRMHCYRCDRAEVTLRTCPDCSGKE